MTHGTPVPVGLVVRYQVEATALPKLINIIHDTQAAELAGRSSPEASPPPHNLKCVSPSAASGQTYFNRYSCKNSTVA